MSTYTALGQVGDRLGHCHGSAEGEDSKGLHFDWVRLTR